MILVNTQIPMIIVNAQYLWLLIHKYLSLLLIFCVLVRKPRKRMTIRRWWTNPFRVPNCLPVLISSNLSANPGFSVIKALRKLQYIYKYIYFAAEMWNSRSSRPHEKAACYLESFHSRGLSTTPFS